MTPMLEGVIRGVIAGVLIGILRGVESFAVEGKTTEMAVADGLLFALPVWIGLTGYGAYDQNRANKGLVIESDVPVAIAARQKNVKPSTAVKDFAPANLRKL